MENKELCKLINKIIKNNKNITNDFFKLLILEFIENVQECGEYKYNITENQIDEIVTDIIGDDYIWEQIDMEIGEKLSKFRKRRK